MPVACAFDLTTLWTFRPYGLEGVLKHTLLFSCNLQICNLPRANILVSVVIVLHVLYIYLFLVEGSPSVEDIRYNKGRNQRNVCHGF